MRMAERLVTLVDGARYYAGVDLPFFVPRSVVTAAAQDMGFVDISWHDRDQPPPVDPARADSLYSDDWDEWATGVYRGPTRVEKLERAPEWIVMQQPQVTGFPRAQSRPQAPTPTADQAKTAGSVPARIQQIVNQALASGSAEHIRETAEALRAGGWETLSTELRKGATALAQRLTAAAKEPSNWPIFLALDLALYAGAAAFLKRRKR